MITCRPVVPRRTLYQRSDLYEVRFAQAPRVWKTSTEFQTLFLQLQSASHTVPPLSECRPNRFKLHGGHHFHMKRALSYEYLLNWTHKHQLAIFHDFLHLPLPPTVVPITTKTAEPFPVSGIVFVLVCLMCIGLSANQDNNSAAPRPKVMKPSPADYTNVMFALQLICFATVQLFLRIHTAPVVSNKDRIAIMDFSLREQIIEDEEEYETDEEEEAVVVLMRGEVMVEEDVYIELEEDSFVLKNEEVSFEYTSDDDDEWASQADYFTDSEASTELSSGNEDEVEEENSRRRTNWQSAAKEMSVCYHQDDESEDLFYNSTATATKAIVGVASVVLIAGVAMRMRRWLS